MTTNQTIDGVPRELLERAISATMVARGPGSPTERDLRDLLDAPAKPMPISDGEMIKMINKTAPHADRDNDLFYLRFGKALQQLLTAAQPQCEPVARIDGMYGDPEAFAEREIRALCDVNKLKIGTLLYAEQPAPVAVVLPARPRADEEEYERMTDYEKGLLHGGIELWDKIDEVNGLNAKRLKHATPPPGAEPSGTHPHNDGLDEMRKT